MLLSSELSGVPTLTLDLSLDLSPNLSIDLDLSPDLSPDLFFPRQLQGFSFHKQGPGPGPPQWTGSSTNTSYQEYQELEA